MDDQWIIQKTSVDLTKIFLEKNSWEVGDLSKVMKEIYTQVNDFFENTYHKNQTLNTTAIQCLLCKKNTVFLKKHLHQHHNITVEEYRTTFNLPYNSALTPEAYSKKRSQIAKNIQLGTKKKS